MSTSSGSLTPHGLSQGGGAELVSNSFSKFQQLDFEISDSSLQSSTVLVDNFGYNSLLGITDFFLEVHLRQLYLILLKLAFHL